LSDTQSEILEALNLPQREAVTTTEGPVLVLAGAGSGKTRVLTHRIAYLIQKCGVSPQSILAVTFTNKAAGEMKARILKLLGEAEGATSGTPTMGTFHSICAQILRRDIGSLDRAHNFVIFDSIDQLSLIKKALKEVAPNSTISPRAVLSAISRAKNECMTPEAFAVQKGGDYFSDIVGQVFPIYQKRLKDNEALDFDDLLGLTVELFQEHPAVLEKYQRMWQYLLIDEYQDTNHVQYLLVKLLSEEHHNLCVVGDDDQSIYGFRGANIGNILAFEKDNPDTKVIKLEQNYRSTQPVLDAAFHVIQENTRRTEKRLWTDRKEGQAPHIYEALNETDEASYVVGKAQELHDNHKISLNEMAVLYRTNAQSRAFEEACMQAGLPYRLVGGVKFYERKEIKDLLAFLRIIQNPEDEVSLERVVNIPPRGIGAGTLTELHRLVKETGGLKAALEALHTDLGDQIINSRGRENLYIFHAMVESWRELNRRENVLEVFDQVMKETGYLEYINDGTTQAEDRYENIKELRTTISAYTEFGPQHGLSVLLEEVSLMTDIDRAQFASEALTLITLHQVKGLEFEVVFLAGMEEGLFPHSRALLEEKELEEERRICYVGITRAKAQLFLTHAESRSVYGESRPGIASRFLVDLPDDLVTRSDWEDKYVRKSSSLAASSRGAAPVHSESTGSRQLKDSKAGSKFKEGQRVKHGSFGSGVVVQIKGDELTVVFDKVGLKRLLESLAPLAAG